MGVVVVVDKGCGEVLVGDLEGGGLSSHITSSCFAKCVAFENWMMRKTLKRENTDAGFVKSPNSPL